MQQQVRTYSQMNLRTPPELVDWLKRHAEENHRSLTAQVVMILEGYRERNDRQQKQQDRAPAQ